MNKLNEIQQKLSVPKNQRNTFGNYNYRSCEDILEAVKPLLGETTLIITDNMIQLGDRYYVKSIVRLSDKKSGEFWEAEGFAREAQTKKGMDESQITGAASSYARKYALNGLFAIDDTKDADAADKDNPKEPTPAASTTPGLFKYQKIIGLALMAMNDNDNQRAGNMLKEMTKGTDVNGKEFHGINSTKLIKSEKQAKVILNYKIKEKYSLVYDWDELEKNEMVVMLNDGLPFEDTPIPESAKTK